MRISDWSSDVCSSDLWSSLARGGSTLAFYMGREAAGEIRRGLMQAGMPGEMPVMIACEVSGPGERRLVTRLDLLDIAHQTFAADAPTHLMVGARPEARRVGQDSVITCISREYRIY